MVVDHGGEIHEELVDGCALAVRDEAVEDVVDLGALDAVALQGDFAIGHAVRRGKRR